MTLPPAAPALEAVVPARLPVLALAQTVVFPHVVVPIAVTSPATVEVIDRVVESHKRVLLGVLRSTAESDLPPGVVEDAPPDAVHEVGTLAAVVRLLKLGDGSLRMLLQGLERVRLVDLRADGEGLSAGFAPVPSAIGDPLKTEALRRSVTTQMERVIEMTNLSAELQEVLAGITDAGKLADFVAANLDVAVEAKAELLATGDVAARLERLSALIGQELQVLEVGTQISEKVKSRLDEHQREYVLREQLKAIQEELGEGGLEGEMGELLKKLEAAKPSEEALAAGRRELERLGRMSPQSAEYQVSRTYVEVLAGLPWSVLTEDRLDIAHARSVLDRDHFDLERVKDRIIEYLAVRFLNPEAHGSILCFVGPPGTGKTSVGQSIAEALGRRFARMALGGMRDEAEIRGHRRTYVGALPGRIIQLLQRAGSRNPVFMLDEVDKLGADFRGDPTSALLEVLDPAQNHSFVDHYVEVPFSLRDVMFIATANTLATVPPPLIDRMEVLELPGYTPREKLEIARRYLVPRQLRETGLAGREVTVTDGALQTVIGEYTREAGVRQLEREIQHVLRQIVVDVVDGRSAGLRVTTRTVRRRLGPPKVLPEVAGREPEVGVMTGLAWTPTGGDILFIEALKMPGKGAILITGQLGDVMRESAEAAWSLVRSKALALGVDPATFQTADVHLHVPAGAVPKDGPSAGVAIATALASLASGRPVRPDVAATGELTLRGHVLPVGGIKEKLIAAERAGIRLVLAPARNAADVAEVPEEVRKKLEIRLVDTVDAVLEAALLPARAVAARPAARERAGGAAPGPAARSVP
ncbi:MAG TPA: endopeptidase La [Gemmatimonadales bacterium]|nr:endopeptidase La [Gemmatimonadales bacterium]